MSKGYASAAILTLALAIGANTAIFSVVHAVLLKPLPLDRPDRLVVAWAADVPRDLAVVELSYRNFQDWASHNRSFTQVAAMGSSTWPAVLEGRDGSVRLASAGVSASFFDTLGTAPLLGRTFRADDDLPNAPRVAILSHATWIGRFGGDPGVVGTTIQLGQLHTIIGIMPDGFDVPRGVEIWTPVVPILAGSGGNRQADALETVGVLFVIGRLREGVTPRMATDELNRVAADLEHAGSGHRFGTSVVVTPFLDYFIGPVRQALWILTAAGALILFIACINVSGLMLTRVSLKQRERAIRLALGATRAQLTWLWAREALLICAAGGAIGLAASRWAAHAIVALGPDDVPRLTTVSLDWSVAAFTFVAVLATATVCGAAPVRLAASTQAVETLAHGTRTSAGPSRHGGRSLLLVVQIAIMALLLVSAGLLVRSFANLRRIDLGFEPAHVLTLNVSGGNPGRSGNAWIEELLRRVSQQPDVEAAGAVYLRPLALGAIGQETSVILEGQPETVDTARGNPTLNYQVATPGYFRALRIPLDRGRLFAASDTAASEHVAIVSRSTAQRLWRGGDAIGRRILMPTNGPDGPGTAWRTVVGIVGDVRYRGLDDLRLDVYDAAGQSPTIANDLVIRASGDPLGHVAAIAADARRLDTYAVLDRVTTLDAVVARAVAPWRFSAWVLTLLAAMAAALAGVGLFSVVSLDVCERRHELAIRLALGAQRTDVLRSIFSAAGRRVLAGLAIGLAGAAGAGRVIRSLLFGIDAVDVPTYLAVAGVVAGIVLAASYVPARRAGRVEPLPLLRAD